jgi:hypothetical protein
MSELASTTTTTDASAWEARKEAGNVHFAAKEYSEAIACWTEARALVVASYPVGEKNNNRGAAICCANISAAQLLLGDAEEALRSAQASMRYDRTYKKALLREARALSRMGCHEEARFAEALHALPDESFENCGRTFINEVHSQESVVEQQAMFMDIVSALRNDDGGGGGGGGDGDGDGGGQDGASVAAVGAEPANARWRAQLSAWGLRREVDAVPVGDLEGAAQLLADVVEAQALEHLYRRNGNAEPPPLLANFSFVRKFLTPHDLPCLKGMVLSQHCWGAKLQAFLPIPLPGWPDNDPFPWDAAAHVARVKPGHSGNGKPLRGRLIWSSNADGDMKAMAKGVNLFQVFHHVWDLPSDGDAKTYWAQVMPSRTEEGKTAVPITRLWDSSSSSSEAAAAVGEKGQKEGIMLPKSVRSCDGGIILGGNYPMRHVGVEVHSRIYLFRIGRTCCKLYIAAMAPLPVDPDTDTTPAKVDAICVPIVRRAVHRVRVASAVPA